MHPLFSVPACHCRSFFPISLARSQNETNLLSIKFQTVGLFDIWVMPKLTRNEREMASCCFFPAICVVNVIELLLQSNRPTLRRQTSSEWYRKERAEKAKKMREKGLSLEGAAAVQDKDVQVLQNLALCFMIKSQDTKTKCSLFTIDK